MCQVVGMRQVYKGLVMLLLSFSQNQHENDGNGICFIRVCVSAFCMIIQPRQLQFGSRIYKVWEEYNLGEIPSWNAYKRNGFTMVPGTLLRKYHGTDQ